MSFLGFIHCYSKHDFTWNCRLFNRKRTFCFCRKDGYPWNKNLTLLPVMISASITLVASWVTINLVQLQSPIVWFISFRSIMGTPTLSSSSRLGIPWNFNELRNSLGIRFYHFHCCRGWTNSINTNMLLWVTRN